MNVRRRSAGSYRNGVLSLRKNGSGDRATAHIQDICPDRFLGCVADRYKIRGADVSRTQQRWPHHCANERVTACALDDALSCTAPFEDHRSRLPGTVLRQAGQGGLLLVGADADPEVGHHDGERDHHDHDHHILGSVTHMHDFPKRSI